MSDTFPDETLYPVLASLADEDRIFASNSAAGHESSQIKGSTIKGLINACRPKHPYVAITTASTAIAAERGNTYGVNANGCTLNLPSALTSGYMDGDEICVVVGVSAARELAIVSTSFILRGTGLQPVNTPFNVTGFGTFISFVKCTNVWVMSYPEYELRLKAPLASPALTGTPTAPTAAVGTNSTQLATTAFCAAALAGKANDADVVKLTGNQSIGGTKTFTTSPVLPTPTAGDNTTKGATTAFVTGAVAGVTASSIGLGSVDNTADTAKPVSTAQAAAIAACRPKHPYVAITTASTAIAAERGNTYGVNANGCTLNLPSALTSGYMDGDEICVVVGVSAARKLAIVSTSFILRGTGLQPVNTPFNVTGFGTFISFVKCTNVWVMSYPEYELSLKAPLASPALTGTPTAPTAAVGTNTTQLATTAFCAAGFLPQFSAVVETGTNVTSPSVGTLYVSTRSPGDGSTPGSASLTCTLPSPTGNGGKVIGFSCKYGTYDSWNWQYDEANWSVQGHIDGVANNTNFTQHNCRPSGVIFWCNGTTWMRVSTWGAFDEHVY